MAGKDLFMSLSKSLTVDDYDPPVFSKLSDNEQGVVRLIFNIIDETLSASQAKPLKDKIINVSINIMNRKILLIEPKYKNKYPPIGLMKIATYHRRLGDSVEFFKGDLKDLVHRKLTDACIENLAVIDSDIDWRKHTQQIHNFVKTKKLQYLPDLHSATMSILLMY